MSSRAERVFASLWGTPSLQPLRQLGQRWPWPYGAHTHTQTHTTWATHQSPCCFLCSCLYECLHVPIKLSLCQPSTMCQNIKQHNNITSKPLSKTIQIVSEAHDQRGKGVFLAAGEQNIAAWLPEITLQSAWWLWWCRDGWPAACRKLEQKPETMPRMTPTYTRHYIILRHGIRSDPIADFETERWRIQESHLYK